MFHHRSGHRGRRQRKALTTAISVLTLSVAGICFLAGPGHAASLSATRADSVSPDTNNFYYGYWSSTDADAGQNLPCTGGTNYTNLPSGDPAGMRSWANGCNVRVWIKGPNGLNLCEDPAQDGGNNSFQGIDVTDIQITSDTSGCPATPIFTYGYWSGSGAPVVMNLPCIPDMNYNDLPSGNPSGDRTWQNGCAVRVWMSTPGGGICTDPGYGDAGQGLDVYNIQITTNTELCPGPPNGS